MYVMGTYASGLTLVERQVYTAMHFFMQASSPNSQKQIWTRLIWLANIVWTAIATITTCNFTAMCQQ